jgi:hypothetical protein
MLPTNTRKYILNHLVQHFEILALLSLWELPSVQGQFTQRNPEPGATTTHTRSAWKPSNSSPPTQQSSTPVLGWIVTPGHNRYYRWKRDAEGQIRYQWLLKREVEASTPAKFQANSDRSHLPYISVTDSTGHNHTPTGGVSV